MSFPENFPEMDERIPEMDKLWLLEKEAEMFTEWQMWEDEQSLQLPAKVEMLTPIPVRDEIQSDTLPF